MINEYFGIFAGLVLAVLVYFLVFKGKKKEDTSAPTQRPPLVDDDPTPGKNKKP